MTIEEQEAWREVDAACARLTETPHLHSKVGARRIEVERAVANLKRLLGADQPVRYTTNELQASPTRPSGKDVRHESS